MGHRLWLPAVAIHRLGVRRRRRDDSHMTRTVLDMEAEGARPRGRLILRYTDTIRRDIKKNALTKVNILDRNDCGMAVKMGTQVNNYI